MDEKAADKLAGESCYLLFMHSCFLTYFIKSLLGLLLYFKGMGTHTYTKNIEHEHFLKGHFYVPDTH